ncbi:MAG: HEAT repeat domain-containing protein, partial [Gimesia sp.]|nr:HEAT repeat domain-containing protein [Gimesia sp.]
MAFRFMIALLVAFCLIVALQMTGALGVIGTVYRSWTLKRLAHGDVESIAQARRYLNSKDVLVRSAAAGAFGRIGLVDAEALSELIAKVNTDVPQVASSAAWSLGFVKLNGPGGDNDTAYQGEVLGTLIRAVSHKDSRV